MNATNDTILARIAQLPAQLRALSPSRQSGRRGAALIISLFVLLAITGIGLVAVQTSTQEIQAAGNYRLNKQAESVSAGALTVAMGDVSQAGDAYWTYMKQEAYAAADDAGVSAAEIDKSFTFGTADFTNRYMDANGADASTLTPEMTVVMGDPLDGFVAPGYSDSFCFKRFRFDADATVGKTNAEIAGSRDLTGRHSSHQHRSFALLGPMECEGN